MRPPERARPGPPEVLVTGCAGFIGSAVCEALTAEGRRVVGVDGLEGLSPPEERAANLAALADEAAFTLLPLDLCAGDLDRLLASRPTVVHMAGRPGVRDSFGPGLPACLLDNVEATGRLLDAALRAGVPRMVWASSSSVYGGAHGPAVGEDSPLRPRSPYGIAKRACEDLAALARARGLEVTALRYFTVYGPRQRPDMAIRRMCEALSGGPPFPLMGDGEQARDLTHVTDAVDAALRALAAPRVAPVYNVAGGRIARLSEVIALLEDLGGARLPVARAGPAPGDVRLTVADTSRARADLGWAPRVPLRAGLAAQLEWTRALARAR